MNRVALLLVYARCLVDGLFQVHISLSFSQVSQQLGDEASAICGALIKRPQRTLKEIHEDTKILLPQLRNCLLVLVQHNLVRYPISTTF